jgi:hypothetical protein
VITEASGKESESSGGSEGGGGRITDAITHRRRGTFSSDSRVGE